MHLDGQEPLTDVHVGVIAASGVVEVVAAPVDVPNQVRLALFILAYNLGNFLHRLYLSKAVKQWSLRSVHIKLIKIGARLVRHARRLVFQLGEVAVSREVFREVLEHVSVLHAEPG